MITQGFLHCNVHWHGLIGHQKAYVKKINGKVLLENVCPIGFLKNTMSWYESYLAEPHFTVEVANWVYKDVKFAGGVSQGLMLGPPLFLFMSMI